MRLVQKIVALQRLGEVVTEPSYYGGWHTDIVSLEIAVGSRGLVGVYGKGETQEDSINDLWRQIVEDLTSDQYLVIHAMDPKLRRTIRWDPATSDWKKVADSRRR